MQQALGSIPLFASINCSFPQDWILTSAPSTNWASIVISADGSNLVAALSGGGMFASRDSGISWVQTTAPSNNWSRVASSADGVNLENCSRSKRRWNLDAANHAYSVVDGHSVHSRRASLTADSYSALISGFDEFG